MSARRPALLTAPKASAPALHVATLLRDEGAVVESGRGYHHTAVKHRLVHTLQKYLLNPPIRLLLALQIVPPGYALLETVGRVTGKPRRTPVGNGLQGETFWIVSEHGQKAGYVGNIQHSARVRVRFRHGFRFRWRTGTAHLMPQDDPRERQRLIGRGHPVRALNALAVRGLGTELLTVRIDLDPASQ